jgi:sugar diacid utilization regulator
MIPAARTRHDQIAIAVRLVAPGADESSSPAIEVLGNIRDALSPSARMLGPDTLLVTTSRSDRTSEVECLRACGRAVVEAAAGVGADVCVGVALVSGSSPTAQADAAGDARRAVGVVSQRPQMAGVAVFEDVMAQLAVTGDADLRTRLASLLDPIVDPAFGGRQVIATLQAFFTSPSLIAAGRQLGIHRHTIEHRIRHIESMLGRSIRSSPDRFLVEAALQAWLLEHR